MKRKQSGFKIMMRLIKLVKPLAFFMVLAVILGVTGFLCAIQITVFGSMTLLTAAGINGGLAIKTGCICIIIFAVLRGFLHYGEQACNHYIAFKLLAIRLFKQVVIHNNIKWLFGIFAFAEDNIIGIICCYNINFCIFSVPPFADFCGSETEK